MPADIIISIASSTEILVSIAFLEFIISKYPEVGLGVVGTKSL